MAEKELLEEIRQEQETYSDDSLYNITSFGIDMSFRELITMYKEGDLEKPELQRKYVWTKAEAGRFIDSILLGLPVPSIFLAKTPDNKRLIVDGYQRIMTVYDYMEGIFSADGSLFKLPNSEMIYSAWRGKAFSELSDAQKRTIRTSPIHAIVFEQKRPSNDTGMYQIFERINTGGRVLKPQEIRNCIYHGKYNDMLFELNRNEIWRTILGSKIEDSRMADVELILRFFAFNELDKRPESEQKQINLVKFLNVFMKSQEDLSERELEDYKKRFILTVSFLYSAIGEHVFRTISIKKESTTWAKKVNPVVFDAICTATVKVSSKVNFQQYCDGRLFDRYKVLMLNEEFQNVCKQRTTNMENIRRRVELAKQILYGDEK